LKASEEAKCAGTTCDYKWTDKVPAITKMTPEFKNTKGAEMWTVKIEGTDIVKGGNLEINKVAQKYVSHKATEVIFQITNVDDLKQVKTGALYFPVGLPKDHANV
jgi:hypothetical protein